MKFPLLPNASRTTSIGLVIKTVSAVLLAANSVVAGNVLLNPSFEANNGSSQTIPLNWTYFKPPFVSSSTKDYWIVSSNTVDGCHMPAQEGQYYWKQWFVGTNNVAGLYQMFSSSAGSIYQASGWVATSSCDTLGGDCATWIQVEFLSGTSNLLAIYKSANFTAAAGIDTWLQFPVTNACDPSQPVSIGDPYFTTYAITGSVSQLVAPAGTASVLYRYCYLTAGSGSLHAAFFDDAVLNQVSGPAAPVISSLFPQDTMIFVNPSNGISFNVTSPSGFTINNSGIHLSVNGSDVSGSLTISGPASSKNVSYSGLQSNTVYTATISVTDASSLTVNQTIQFQTMWYGLLAPTYIWEAEDWDFTNGMYINFPDLCNAAGDPNCYFGKVGSPGLDEYNLSGASGAYRSGDPMGTGAAGDALRPTLYAAGRPDYRIDPFITTEWLDYTRDWPNSTNWVIARASANLGDAGSLTLSVVNPDLSTTDLGVFSITSGQGYSAFQNLFLKDTNGNNAVVILNGRKTLRVTSGGNVLPNFFMLVAAQADVPLISNLYPSGQHPFEPTNTLSFTVTALGSSFPANGIHVVLDGVDVSSNLNITGSTSVKNVVYPGLLPNAIHTALITVTNALGHGIAVTNNFDTFSEQNFMVEFEDFDYGGGQYIPNSGPDAYADSYGPFDAVTNVDFQHMRLSGDATYYSYRSIGLPQDLLGQHDWLRSNFQYSLATDYILAFFAGGDWGNYTRDYPPGSYYAYARSSGDGPFFLYLDQVVSGVGTVNQTLKRLGTFGGNGKDYITFAWVPLTDDGLQAPAVVHLNGVTTLRVTTGGNCNPNYFMLVPAGGIKLNVAASGGNAVLSFPTQNGATYRVFYRTDLNSGGWTQLTTLIGNGGVKSVTDPATGTRRFYKVTAP